MAKFDTRSRMQRGIQPGLAPIMLGMDNKMMPTGAQNSMGMPFGNNPMMGGDMRTQPVPIENNLLSPSFESVMNQNPNMNNAVQKRAIGTRPSVMNRLNNTY